MYFSQSVEDQTGVVTCLVSDRSWSYDIKNQNQKKAAVDAALQYQERLLQRLHDVATKDFFTLAELQAAFATLN